MLFLNTSPCLLTTSYPTESFPVLGYIFLFAMNLSLCLLPSRLFCHKMFLQSDQEPQIGILGRDEFVCSGAVNYSCPVDMLMEGPFKGNCLPASQDWCSPLEETTTVYMLDPNSFCLIYKTYLRSDIDVSKSFNQICTSLIGMYVLRYVQICM